MAGALPRAPLAGPFLSQLASSDRERAGQDSAGDKVARRPNYGFEKKQRELKKQKKKQEKAERRAREADDSGPDRDEAAENTTHQSERSEDK